MIEGANAQERVSLQNLQPGSVIDLDTKHHNYRIEYLGGDKAQISGHPRLCPRPVTVLVEGSIGSSIEADTARHASGLSTIGRSSCGHYVGDHRRSS